MGKHAAAWTWHEEQSEVVRRALADGLLVKGDGKHRAEEQS